MRLCNLCFLYLSQPITSHTMYSVCFINAITFNIHTAQYEEKCENTRTHAHTHAKVKISEQSQVKRQIFNRIEQTMCGQNPISSTYVWMKYTGKERGRLWEIPRSEINWKKSSHSFVNCDNFTEILLKFIDFHWAKCINNTWRMSHRIGSETNVF